MKVVICVWAQKDTNLSVLTQVGRRNLKHKEGVLRK